MLPAADGRVALDALLADLVRREVNELHVEAGETLNGALLAAGLVDEWLMYLAPLMLGAGRGMAAGMTHWASAAESARASAAICCAVVSGMGRASGGTLSPLAVSTSVPSSSSTSP